MFDLVSALKKILGNKKTSQPVRGERISKHSSGAKRPKNFDAKRKVHRKMAKASRRINRKQL